MIVAHLFVSALPANGTSVGRYVRRAVAVLEKSGIALEVHATGTEIEAPSLRILFAIVEQIDGALVRLGAQRVTIQLKIDDRRDKRSTIASKQHPPSRASVPRGFVEGFAPTLLPRPPEGDS